MNAVFSRFLAARAFKGAACFVAAFSVALLAGAHPAMAAISMGEVFCDVADNITPFLDVFNMIAYVAGGWFVIHAFIHTRHHTENPNQHPYHKIFANLFGGAALLALPSFAGMLIDTLFFDSGDMNGDGGIIGSCADSSSSLGGGVGSAVPLDVMMTNFINNIRDPLTFLVSIVAIALGVYLIIRGLIKASKYGTDPRTHSITNILTNLIIGTVLVVVGQSVDVIMSSVFGSSGIQTFESLSWASLDNATGGDTSQFKAAVKAALTFFQLVGLISFVRGWNVIRNAVEGTGQATVAQGLTHIIGGVLAINIYMFMQMMDYTFGTNFVS